MIPNPPIFKLVEMAAVLMYVCLNENDLNDLRSIELHLFLFLNDWQIGEELIRFSAAGV